MALIKCMECGKEISDKAAACPNCGCPADECNIVIEKPLEEMFDKTLVEIHKELGRHSISWGKGKEIDAICSRMNVDKDTAKKLYKEIRDEEIKRSAEKYKREHPEKMTTQEFVDDFNRRQAERKIPKCPRCKSTSLTYTTKKLSLGRAAVGYGLAGPAGGVLGGLTSKKGYAVCLNCGKKWKI